MASIASTAEFSLHHYVILLASLIFAILIGGSVYRLYFHPLASYPGPKLAALTLWYEFYYDCIKGGQYTFEIGRMHKKYGPIIRISPHELHVNDPSFINELYAGGNKRRDKYYFYARQFGPSKNIFGTVPHDLHRARRAALSRFFSKASVAKLEPLIVNTVQKLCAQIETYAGTGKPVELSTAFSCMTTDIVTEYAFARSPHFCDSPTFEPNFKKAILKGTGLVPFVKQFPWIMPLAKAMPVSVTSHMDPQLGAYVIYLNSIKTQIIHVMEEQTEKKNQNAAHPTIFHELLQGDLPEEEKELDRLWAEGQLVVGAGTETTAWALSVMMFYLLADPTILSRLVEELVTAIPDPSQLPSGAVLTQLPFLITVISEGLRLSYGAATRLQRVSPLTSLHFKSSDGKVESYIPPGTPVGMTSVHIHQNPDIFPDPLAFIPERWMNDQNRKREDRLDRYLLSFSKGSRQCLGMNLAYTELYFGVAAVIRTFGNRLELFETTQEDVEAHRDCFIPRAKVESKGIRLSPAAEYMSQSLGVV
ncbi:cytochrome p450 [Lasallia pustulata]|uniref:Cytochrome p450 n=1 Tax=Lasallia pustulata TaxID=136370 RepID=A0A1W5DDM6_9LECA|nr:cytochrome p450 [Lasallia pustulata]